MNENRHMGRKHRRIRRKQAALAALVMGMCPQLGLGCLQQILAIIGVTFF